MVSAATASTGGAGATSSPPEEEAVAVSAAAVEEEECVADAGSISQLSELSEFKLLDSSKMMSSLSSKHSALRVIRSGLIPPEDDPPPPPQQIPESSEPRLDWTGQSWTTWKFRRIRCRCQLRSRFRMSIFAIQHRSRKRKCHRN